MALTQIQTDEITLTQAAAEAVNDMLAKRDLKDHALRVYIAGGGCSGHQYGMALEGNVRDSDFIFEQYGVKVAIDDVSLSYLRGSVINYIDDVMGSGFKIENPNATSTCGCGHSFRTDGQAAPHGEGAGC
jgi:iron-sulfur cluster assembly protein